MSPDSIALLRQGPRPQVVPVSRPRTLAVAVTGLDDEVVNSVTHGIGLVFSAVGCCYLLALPGERGLTVETFGCVVFGIAMVAMYAASTTYHAAPRSRLKEVLRRLDHACIFVLIAGTYTPFALGPLWGPLGWGLMVVVWGVGGYSAWGKLTAPSDTLAGSYWSCVGLGWMAVLMAVPLMNSTAGIGAVLWLLAGGLSYTAGIYFYVRDDRHLYHAVWHLFVLAGSACQFAAVWLHVVR